MLGLATVTAATGGVRARGVERTAISAQPGEFTGTWKNKNANTNSVTKIVISIKNGAFQIYSYGKCSPSDCDWSTYQGVGGPQTPPVSEASDGIITIVWHFGFETTTQTLTLLSNGTLQVVTHTVPSNGTPRDITELFANTTDRKLTIRWSGTGNGTVSSSPAGISCNATCSATFPYATPVALTAKPADGSRFDGWENACNGSSCKVRLSLNRVVVTRFNLIPVSFSVSKSGDGSVSSTPNGIGCGATCSASFPWGTQVTLKATPAPRSGFLGWSGDCSGGTPTCSLTAKTPVAVKAAFGSVKLGAATVTAHWQKSRLTGTLTLSGEVTKAAQLGITVQRTVGSSKALLNRSVAVAAGSFRTRLALPKQLLPGRYAVHVGAAMQGVTVPEAVRAIRVLPPREGVVASAYISTTPNGHAVHSVSLDTPKLYAHFEFAPGAPSQLPLTFAWYGPRGKFQGKTTKPRAHEVLSFVIFPQNYPRGRKVGVWGCILRAGNTVVEDAFVRVGSA